MDDNLANHRRQLLSCNFFIVKIKIDQNLSNPSLTRKNSLLSKMASMEVIQYYMMFKSEQAFKKQTKRK